MTLTEMILACLASLLAGLLVAELLRNRRLQEGYDTRGELLTALARRAVEAEMGQKIRVRSATSPDEFPGLAPFNALVEEVVPEDL